MHVISVESNDQREVLIEKIAVSYPTRVAHMTEYAIFTVFTYIALLTDGVRLPKRRYSALLTAVLLASSDELHQWFVPGRSGCVKDVCIDTVGAVAALLVIWAAGTVRNRIRTKKTKWISALIRYQRIENKFVKKIMKNLDKCQYRIYDVLVCRSVRT